MSREQGRVGVQSLPAALLAVALMLAAPQSFAQQVSAGGGHVAVVAENGALWVWGANASGQLGLGDTVDRTQPVRVGEDTDWAMVSAGFNHTLAVKQDGTLWAWGNNLFGQIGNGSASGNRLTPQKIGFDTDWAEVSAGNGYSLALKEDGRLFGWGTNGAGELAFDYLLYPSFLTPQRIGEDSYTSVSAGNAHVLALRSDGALVAWGSNATNQLGVPGLPNVAIFRIQVVNETRDWTKVVAADLSSYALDASGKLYVWGNGSLGRLGNGGTSLNKPTSISGTWNDFDAYSTHVVAESNNGSIWAWGDNLQGQLGIPILDENNQILTGNLIFDTPQELDLEIDLVDIAVGNQFSILIGQNSEVFGAGINDRGQLGNGFRVFQDAFERSFFGTADLLLSGIEFNEGEVRPQDPVPLNIFLTNLGTAAIPSGTNFTVDLYLSRDQVITDDDRFITSFTVNEGIQSLSTLSRFLQVNLPTPIDFGEYFIIGEADAGNVIEETNEINNEGGTASAIEFKPDLRISLNLSGLSGPYGRGDTVTIPVTVINDASTGTGGHIPAGPTGAFEYQLLLSPTREYGSPGQFLLTEAIFTGELASGGSSTFNVTVTFPDAVPLGDFYVVAAVDTVNAVDELLNVPDNVQNRNENNNVFLSTGTYRVEGLSIAESLDSALTYRIGGDGNWFGRNRATGDPSAPTPSYAQSPALDTGERAFFEADIPGPVRIVFEWRTSTSSAQNYLSFSIDGNEPTIGGRISGGGGWRTTSFLLPSPINNVARWTYFQNLENPDDFVAVDNVRIEQLTAPDLNVIDLDYDAGDYVLGNGTVNFTIVGRNQGLGFDTNQTGEPIKVLAYLSIDDKLDPDLDILVDEKEITGFFAPDDRFVYSGSAPIPITYPEGKYYLIIQVDAEDKLPEFDENNNVFISPLNDINLIALPDLIVSKLDYIPGYYFVRDREDNPQTIEIGTIEISNQGISAIQSDPITGRALPFFIDVVLSRDRIFGDDDDFLLRRITEENGLGPQNSRIYRPSFDIPDDVPVGIPYYVGVIVNPDGAVPESNPINNSRGSGDNDVLFSAMPLDVAVDIDDTEAAFTITTNTQFLTNEPAPWFGQRSETFDTIDAAQSIPIGNNSSSSFSFTIDIDRPTIVTFRWSVSSELSIATGIDFLGFYVNGELIDDPTLGITPIAGEVPWQNEVYPITEPGTYTLEWRYVKDSTVAAGQDTGWVDQVRYQVPDLDIIENELDEDGNLVLDDLGNPIPAVTFPTGTFQPGDSFDVAFSLRNVGQAALPGTPPVFIDVLLSPDNRSQNGNDALLRRIEYNRGMEIGERLDFDLQNVFVPFELAFEGEYYLIIVADSDRVVVEPNEGNNEYISTKGVIKIDLPLNLDDALRNNDTEEYDNEVPWDTFGDGVWFPRTKGIVEVGEGASIESSVDPDGPLAGSAQTPSLQPGESSVLTTQITGPTVLSFDWTSRTRANLNFVIFSINGLERARISGARDWQTLEFFIPAGVQEVSWSYEKQGEELPDQVELAFVDNVRTDPSQVSKPELIITRVIHQGPLPIDIEDSVRSTGQAGYVLDRPKFGLEVAELARYAGTNVLRFEVTLENQGTDLINEAGDIVTELRYWLSVDSVFGNEDDFLLGSDNRSESYPSRKIDIFSGNPPLPNDLAAGRYFLILELDPFDTVDEVDEGNNIYISDNPFVNIVRLPNLDQLNFRFDALKQYYPGSRLELDYDLVNKGLANVPGNISWRVRTELYAVAPDDYIGNFESPGDLFSASELVDVVSDYTVQKFMLGRSEENPLGTVFNVTERMFLPDTLQFDAAAQSLDLNIATPYYYFRELIDSSDLVGESNEFNIILYYAPENVLFLGSDGLGEILPFRFATDTYELYRARYETIETTRYLLNVSVGFADLDPSFAFDIGDEKNDFDGDGLPNLLEFMLNTNAIVADQNGYALLTEFNTISIEGFEYRTISFDFNNSVLNSDLSIYYDVEVFDLETETWLPLLDERIVPSYRASVGPRSLNDDGGLTSKPLILAATDNGYTARLTVRDSLNLEEAPLDTGRALRVVVGRFVPPESTFTGYQTYAVFPASRSARETQGKGSMVFVTEELGELYVLEGGWYWSDDYGYLYLSKDSNWVYHLDHGWVYVSEFSGDGQVWFYDSTLGWIGTSKTWYPYLYRFESGDMLYYMQSSSAPRWFYNYTNSEWVSF